MQLESFSVLPCSNGRRRNLVSLTVVFFLLGWAVSTIRAGQLPGSSPSTEPSRRNKGEAENFGSFSSSEGGAEVDVELDGFTDGEKYLRRSDSHIFDGVNTLSLNVVIAGGTFTLRYLHPPGGRCTSFPARIYRDGCHSSLRWIAPFDQRQTRKCSLTCR